MLLVHTNALSKSRTLVWDLHDWALDGKLLTRLKRMDVLRHLALVIPLDEEGELALLVRRRDGSVRADDGLLVLAQQRLRRVACGLDDDARGNGEERSLTLGKLEDVPTPIEYSASKTT